MRVRGWQDGAAPVRAERWPEVRAALVSRRGSIDWLCPPRPSGPSMFVALPDLDPRHDGRFAVPGVGLHDGAPAAIDPCRAERERRRALRIRLFGPGPILWRARGTAGMIRRVAYGKALLAGMACALAWEAVARPLILLGVPFADVVGTLGALAVPRGGALLTRPSLS